MKTTPASSGQFSEQRFWKKISHYSSRAGKEVIEKALWLYYASKRPDTPKWAKRTIYGALFYFINPFDVLTDLSPLIGYSDDLLVLAAAVSTLALYIDAEVKQQTQSQLEKWFPAMNGRNKH